MQLQTRQSIISQKKNLSNQPAYLAYNGSGVDIIATDKDLIVNIAHGTANYLHKEAVDVVNAWMGPFPSTTYLYIDINLLSGVRTFGSTTIAPVTNTVAPVAVSGANWFDLVSTKMFEYNGTVWREVIRIFIGYINGSTLTQFPLGSTVGLSVENNAGFILFDEEMRPVKKFNMFNKGKFLTTETALSSQSNYISNFRLETAIAESIASENMAKWSPVCNVGNNRIGLATNIEVTTPAVGVIPVEVTNGEVITYMTQGYARDFDWDWTYPVNTPLFVSAIGTLTPVVPQASSVQQIATIVDPNTILIKIHPLLRYS